MTKTLFNATWGEHGFLNIEIKNDRPGTLYVYLSRFTAPIVYYKGVPLQIEMDQNFIYVNCLYGGHTVWLFELQYRARDFSGERALAPFEPDVKFVGQPYREGEGNDYMFIQTFGIKILEKIRPFHRQLPVISCNNGNKQLCAESRLISVNQNLLARRSEYFENMFRLQPDLPSYPVEQPYEITNQFVKLACLHSDFSFDVQTIEALMFVCEKFMAHQCFLECVDFLFRTERMARIDALLILEKFPQFSKFMNIMGKQVNAEFYQKEYRRIWHTDGGRLVSETAKRLMETNYRNMEAQVFEIKYDHRNPFKSSRHWEHTATIKTLEAGEEKEWEVTLIVHTENMRVMLSIHSDNSHPWFVAASIAFRVRTEDATRMNCWAERVIATSETGCKRYKQINKYRIIDGDLVTIIIKINGAFQNCICETFTNFTEMNTFWNLKLIVVYQNENKSEEKTFFVHRELLEQCSTYFKSVLHGLWPEAANNYYRMEDSPERVNAFLVIAYNPRVVITSEPLSTAYRNGIFVIDNNFLEFLDASLFFGNDGMIARLEMFYRGCHIVNEVKKAADRTFPNVFPAASSLYDMYVRRTPLTEAQVAQWQRESRIGHLGLQPPAVWFRNELNSDLPNET